MGALCGEGRVRDGVSGRLLVAWAGALAPVGWWTMDGWIGGWMDGLVYKRMYAYMLSGDCIGIVVAVDVVVIIIILVMDVLVAVVVMVVVVVVAPVRPTTSERHWESRETKPHALHGMACSHHTKDLGSGGGGGGGPATGGV